jgi:non-heme chloroperoxidase
VSAAGRDRPSSDTRSARLTSTRASLAPYNRTSAGGLARCTKENGMNTPVNPIPNPSPTSSPADPDLARQARPGYGVPSQDPRPAAQVPLEPAEMMREANSVLVGGGAMAGTAAGAAIGVALGGPVGVLVGAAIGGVAGAVGTAAASLAASGHHADSADGANSVDGVDRLASAHPDGPAGAAPAPAGAADTAAIGMQAVRLHVEDSGGTGRPVVLIHGWPLSAQAWALQVPALRAAGYRVIAYDRRGFGRSDRPPSGYGYDTLADDLQRVMEQRDLQDVTLVGFSMGGGEVARYIARHGEQRLRSVVFAAAVPPYLMKTADNPEGPLAPDAAQQMKSGLAQDRDAFFEQFTRDFFSAGGVLKVSEQQRADAVALCRQSAQHAALACMESFGTTDFRHDLTRVTVPTLVLHGDADGIVPLPGSGQRTHQAVAHSQLVTVPGAPHGLNVSHAPAFNAALLAFLKA